jgi:hypothetical protein
VSYCRFSSGKHTYCEGTDIEFTPEKSDVYIDEPRQEELEQEFNNLKQLTEKEDDNI